MLGIARKVLLSLFVSAILLVVTACPGALLENIQITLGPNGAVQGEIISFSCIAPIGQDVVSYQWNFGDGNSGSGQSTTHIYNDFGTYTVECRVLTPTSVYNFTVTITIEPFITHLYWTNDISNSIGRAKLDGTDVNDSFINIGSDVVGVAVNRAHIFWTNSANNRIGIADLEGNIINAAFISTGSSPQGIAIDDTYIYWVNLGSSSIGRAMLDGSNVDNSFITGLNSPFGVDVSDSHIYWTENFTDVARAEIDGTNVDQAFILNVGSSIWDVDLTETHLYVSVEGDSAIDRFDLDGTNHVPDLFPGANPSSVTFNEGFAYWGSLSIDDIWRANIDGTGLDINFINASDRKIDITVGPGE